MQISTGVPQKISQRGGHVRFIQLSSAAERNGVWGSWEVVKRKFGKVRIGRERMKSKAYHSCLQTWLQVLFSVVWRSWLTTICFKDVCFLLSLQLGPNIQHPSCLLGDSGDQPHCGLHAYTMDTLPSSPNSKILYSQFKTLISKVRSVLFLVLFLVSVHELDPLNSINIYGMRK